VVAGGTTADDVGVAGVDVGAVGGGDVVTDGETGVDAEVVAGVTAAELVGGVGALGLGT